MEKPPEATQDMSKSKVNYTWVILFMYSVEAEFPFSCENLNNLEGTDFPFYLMEGQLDNKSRIIPFKLHSDQPYCVFAKVQKGKKN